MNAILENIAKLEKKGFCYLMIGDLGEFLKIAKDLSISYAHGEVKFLTPSEQNMDAGKLNILIAEEKEELNQYSQVLNETISSGNQDIKFLLFTKAWFLNDATELLRKNIFDGRFYMEYKPAQEDMSGSVLNYLSKEVETLKPQKTA